MLDEAAMRGVPVVGARRGGIPEYVPETCHPLLFDPDRAGDLGAALQRFQADPTAFAVSPPSGRTWADHLAQVVSAYRDAIAGEP